MPSKDIIEKSINSCVETQKSLLGEDVLNKISAIADSITAALEKDGKVIIFGNGGSASDAEHMAAELVGRFKKERKGFPAISLTTNSAVLTALSNDYSYNDVFRRQLEALARRNDIVIAISTSGNASNALEAVKYAKERGIKTAALLGRDGGKIAGLCDIELIVPQNDTPRIQEAHILIIHIICELVEGALAK